MIELKTDELARKIQEAIDTIGTNEFSKLISITKQTAKRDPLQVLSGLQVNDQDRSFWMNADRTLTLVGTDKVKEISATDNRFVQTEAVWKSLLEDAWIDNPFHDVPGTGVVALGGMSFDPLRAPTKLWEKFQASQFYIPKFLYTVYQGTAYVTVNVVVTKDDHSEELSGQLVQEEKVFLTGQYVNEQTLQIETESEIAPEKWKQAVLKAKEQIAAGEYEKIVMAREVRLYFNEEVQLAPLLERMMAKQQNSYFFAFESAGDTFVGATPERLVKVEKKQLLSTCLAGTAPRGETEAEDLAIGKNLLTDQKNLEEHDFVVQMMKQAIAKSCIDVQIPEKPILYPLKNLQHLYTPVTGTLKENFTIFDVISDLHPTPALGGTPTKDALKFIREHELLDRGWYGAPIGWLDSNDNGEFAVAIRSCLLQKDEASLFAGCGVVKDSDIEMEYEETKIKLLPMLTVLGGE